jgi:diguanylate cyclase (GGDEF)-like protein/PAS domain S-box-containing protein
MPPAPRPDDEAARLAALLDLDILDSPPNTELDAIVRAASLVCGTPIALISLIDDQRQWLKVNVGLPGVTDTPRDQAFCGYTILGDGLMEVADATADPRFSDNPLVIGAPDIRFYAGVPLRLENGSHVGALCVIDRQTRTLDDSQREILRCLGLVASRALGAWKAWRLQRDAARELSLAREQFRRLYESAPAMLQSVGADGCMRAVSDKWLARFCYARDEVIGRPAFDFLTPKAREVIAQDARPLLFREGRIDGLQVPMLASDGTTVEVLMSVVLDGPADGGPQGRLAVLEDLAQRRQVERELRDERRRLANLITATDVGTWEWQIPSGELRVNERWAAILGWTRAELAPISIRTRTDRVHPEDLPVSTARLQRTMAGADERYDCEVRMRHRDGHYVWVLSRGAVIDRAPDGTPLWMYGTMKDISQRKAQEMALRDSQALLEQTGLLAGVGGWVLDPLTRELTWSAETRRIHGVAPDYQPSVEAAVAFYVPDARPVIRAAVTAALERGTPFDVDLPMIRADGTPIWVRAMGSATRAHGRAVRLSGAIQDITERRRLMASLAEQHELLRVTLQSIGDGVITTDAQGRIAWLNPVAERLTGWSAAAATGRPLDQVLTLINELTRQHAPNPVAACLAQRDAVGLANDTVLISRDGREFAIEDSAAPIRSASGEMLGVVLVFHDVSEQRQLARAMSYRASHDALTGLLSRAEFDVRLGAVLQRAQVEGSRHALLFIDLDQFKLVNDTCGHTAGDRLLQQVARLLTELVRASDAVARLGGDEFAVILDHCAPEQAQRLAQRICDRIEEYRFIHEDRRFRIGASIGLVPVDERWTSTATLLQAADQACYAAKEAGRHRVHLWFDTDQAMRARHDESQWATRLVQALDEDRFALFAQRIRPLRAACPGVHAELLLRLVDADGALVSPGAFLPAAERFHLASRIDRWVLQKAAAWMRASPQLDRLDLLCVNLSGQSVGDRAFHRWATQTLREAGPAICRRLCLEITETAAVTNFADAALFIEEARAIGVRVALDDFGAGASSFGYLKTLPVDFLKIDGQFIRDLLTDPLDEAAVRCFADVASVVGMQTVAEFVDHPDVLAKLKVMGVDFAQGFLIHRPAPIAELFAPRDMPAVAVRAAQ